MSILKTRRSLLRPSLIAMSSFLCCNLPYAQDWVPVYEEPKHRLVFENDHALILDVNLPPGYESLYHQHKLDLLYVTISGTKVWAQSMGKEKGFADVKTGDLRFSSDNDSIPYIHRVGNLGTAPFHVIGVGIKDEIVGDIEPLEGDTRGMQLVDRKAHASVYRISLKPGEASGEHRHNLAFTPVYESGGTLRSDTGEAVKVEGGEFLWHPAGESHRFENAGDQTIDIVEVLSH